MDRGTAGGWQASLPRSSNIMVVQFGGGCVAVARLVSSARDGAGASASGGRSCGRARVAVAAAVVSSRT